MAMPEKGVVLLDFWGSMFGQRCRIALAEKGVEYEYREENLEDKSPLLLLANPIHKKIPVLIHDGKPICESLIIVQYKKMYECGTRLWKLKGEAQEEAKKEYIEILKLLEGELGDKEYFGGETFGFVDVALVPFTAWFYGLDTLANFQIGDAVPKLAAWAKRCGERDSVSKTLPEPQKVYEFLCQLKKRFGIE